MLHVFLLATLGTARAQDPAPSAPVGEAATAKESTYSLSARYRYLWLPKGVLNPWYYPSEETLSPRPTANGDVLGLEFGIDKEPTVFTFWAEAWLVNIGEGYWDDTENPPEHGDGDWIRPQGVGMFALGANFGHEWAVTADEKDTWLGFQVSGGVGIGVPWGHFDQWLPGWATSPLTDCEQASSSIVRQGVCEPDKQPKPPAVLPVLDLSIAWRLHIAERGLLRIEGGIHDLPFFGASGGVTF